MSALARLTAATTRLRGVTRDIVRAEATARGLAARQEIRLQAAVQACIDEPVFREALVATWEAARDVVLEQDAAGIPTQSKVICADVGPTLEHAKRMLRKHLELEQQCMVAAASSNFGNWASPNEQRESSERVIVTLISAGLTASRQAGAQPAPKRLTREQVDRIFDAHAEAPTLEFRYLIAEAIQREGEQR